MASQHQLTKTLLGNGLPRAHSLPRFLFLSSDEWLPSYVCEPYQPSMGKTSLGPKSAANTLGVADLQPFATGLSFALCVSYRKGFFQNTRRLALKRRAVPSLHDITSSCLLFLGTHPSRREGSRAQHLKHPCKLLMLFSLFNT